MVQSCSQTILSEPEAADYSFGNQFYASDSENLGGTCTRFWSYSVFCSAAEKTCVRNDGNKENCCSSFANHKAVVEVPSPHCDWPSRWTLLKFVIWSVMSLLTNSLCALCESL